MIQTLRTDQPTILFVDDEEKSRKYFPRIFRRRGNILVAEDGAAGLEVLLSEEGRDVAVVVTDQIMPKMTGLDLLKEASKHNPNIVRVLSTAYTDSALIEEAAQSSLIDYFVSKPWNIPKLEVTLDRAIKHYDYNLGRSEVA